jgi:hypothetical protein
MCIGEHQRPCGSPTMVVSVVLGKVASCDGLLNVKHWVTTERGQNDALMFVKGSGCCFVGHFLGCGAGVFRPG